MQGDIKKRPLGGVVVVVVFIVLLVLVFALAFHSFWVDTGDFGETAKAFATLLAGGMALGAAWVQSRQGIWVRDEIRRLREASERLSDSQNRSNSKLYVTTNVLNPMFEQFRNLGGLGEATHEFLEQYPVPNVDQLLEFSRVYQTPLGEIRSCLELAITSPNFEHHVWNQILHRLESFEEEFSRSLFMELARLTIPDRTAHLEVWMEEVESITHLAHRTSAELLNA